MTSKALYYTIVTGWSAFGFSIMKVTSEKCNQVYGSVDNEPSHRRKDSVKAKFDSYEQAVAKRDGVNNIIESYKPKIKELNDAMNKLHRSELKEIEDFLNE